MPTKSKIGSWLDTNNGAGEAYESGSEPESSSAGSISGDKPQVNGVMRVNGDGDEDSSSSEAEDMDWDEVMKKLRSAVMDRSPKRRNAFAARYLRCDDGAPPAQYIPAMSTTLLSSLQLLTLPEHLDFIVAILMDLVKRDEKLADSADGKLRLGDKMVKWSTAELTRLLSGSTTFASSLLFPYLLLILQLLSILYCARQPVSDFVKSPQFQELVGNLATILDAIEAREHIARRDDRSIVRKRVDMQTRQTLRDIPEAVPAMLRYLLTAPTPSPARNTVLIASITDTAFASPDKGKHREGDEPSLPGLVVTEMAALLDFYADNILGAKTALPPYISTTLHLFLRHCVDQKTLCEKLIPISERMLLRSPEVSFTLTADLLSSVSSNIDLSPLLPGKLVAAVLFAAKSSNFETRSKAVSLFGSLMSLCKDGAVREKVMVEILALPKIGKTTSSEHRVCLFRMASAIGTSDQIASSVVDTIAPLVGRETNESALYEMCSALTPHLTWLLQSGRAVNPASSAILAKELNSSKTSTKRALSNGIGNAIWEIHDRNAQLSPTGGELMGELAHALETNLQSASANLASNPPGFLEGYVAAALALGPLRHTSSASKLTSSPALQGMLTVSPKPSYLLNDKVYTKLASAIDGIWLLRCLETISIAQGIKAVNSSVRVALGLAYIYLVFDGKESDLRRDAIKRLRNSMRSQPATMGRITRDGLQSWLKTNFEQRSARQLKALGEGDTIVSKSRDIGRLLSAVFVKQDGVDKRIYEDLAVDFSVISHHPEIGADAQVSWISLLQSVGLDPAMIAVERKDQISDAIWKAASAPPVDNQLAEAAYRAVTTLSFICPAIYVTAVEEQIRGDLDPASLDFIGLEERGIWGTPVDQVYVNVLSTKKETTDNKNRKDYATEKWEAEIRASLAQKKTATPSRNLSKVDEAAVAAQLAKEMEVRAKIAVVQARLKRGTELVASLVTSNAEAVGRQVGQMAQRMLGSVFGAGSFLMDQRPFEVFLQLASLATERLGEYRRMLAAATLRSYDALSVPDDYLHEGLADMVTRLLHQVQFVASNAPLDGVTYAISALLMRRVVELGGVGKMSAQSEEAQEQMTLVVNIIGACCGEFHSDIYPRLSTIRDLFSIIESHMKLANDATSALVDLGAAVKDVATTDEIRALINGTLSKDANVRSAALQALQPVDLTDLDYSEELWIAAHDDNEQNASLANHLWEDNGLDVPETYLPPLLRYLEHDSAAVRLSCASAIADATEHYPDQVESTLKGLEDMYIEKAKILQPEYDRFGMIIAETVKRGDPFETRIAIASAFEKLAPLISQSLVSPIFGFFISQQALGDRHSEVRRTMLNASIAIVDTHGREAVTSLMKMFEEYLVRGVKAKGESEDYIKEAVVILFGRLARHLDVQDPRIPLVVDRLVEALDTPSELVQSAAADCLPPLVAGMGDEVEYLVDKLFSSLTTGAKYAGRRGAAYGLAGVVKGRGLGALKEYDLMDKLKEAAEEKGAYQSRQGALFAFETLSVTIGKAFEPYIISIIPLLLALFGDSNVDVREATQDAAKTIMSRVSGHCVKLMLPTLLGGLEEKQWRTKKGSIELLGAMAFCAPRQLSLSLPTIIPQLTGVINDSHAQVKSAANTSLKRFGEVLSNPEIKAMQSILMKALADPAAKTTAALGVLLKTDFEHYLDAPSLALVMPIIDRGLRQRSSDIKRKSVQIVGNMASLTESRDLVPYLHELMPLVHEVLVDPVPEARATAAKSLGTLVERLGEPNFPSLVPDLLQTLRSDTSGVDRQGAAQGLSEVLSGLGMERLEGLLPDVIQNTASPRAYVREGFISLLVYLPATFGHRFAPHLGRVVPPILNGLADDSEFVREASMRAGKMIIANYSNKAIDLLLPELEKGMLDPAWRIRQSSISLTGELLYRVTGISGKVELEEEEAPVQSADNARKALFEALGAERRDRVLATLYIVRQDVVGIVRQASIHIWKALVQNTPRTTREILPILMDSLMTLLGSSEVEQQETASRTLGELCRKNGERIFGEIMPILQKAISSPDERTKEGACLAFADVMAASSKDVISDYEGTIISAVRVALVDPSPTVRAAAARTFDTTQHYMGAKAVDQTIPTLLEAMRNPGEGSETALQALKEVMSVRANSVFPVLVPTLIAQPITAFNARALGALVKVAGTALNRRLDTVLGALAISLEKEQEENVKTELDGAVEALLESVVDSDGVHLLEMLLIGWAKDSNPSRRVTACGIFATMCRVSSADPTEYRVDWIRILITLLDDKNSSVVDAAWESLEAFVKTVDKDDLEDLVVPLRRSIESTREGEVPGFSRPKGVQSIVPILLAGVLNGTQEQREQAALGIGDLVKRTSEAAIKPYIIQLTGPLIRVISGQALAPQIKSAILLTLTVLLEQVPQLVRPFHPQLTRTFVKSASDPIALSVRNRAAAGLGELMKHQPRVDPLVTELVGGVKTGDKEVAPSMVQALAAVCHSAGKNIGAAARASVIKLVEETFAKGRGETYNVAMSKVVAGLAQNDPESIHSIVAAFLAAPTPPTPLCSLTILSILESAPSTFHDLDVAQDVVAKVVASIAVESSGITRPAREARDIMKSKWDDKEELAAFK